LIKKLTRGNLKIYLFAYLFTTTILLNLKL